MKYKIKYKYMEKTYINESSILDIKSSFKNSIYSLKLIPNQNIELISCELDLEEVFHKDELFFSNGYQSWTTTSEQSYKDINKHKFALNLVEKIYHFKEYGDYNFIPYHKHYSFSYTYLRKNDNYRFFGSITERNGYTVFYADDSHLKCFKEIKGLNIDSEYSLFDIFIKEGKENIFDEYFSLVSDGRSLKCKDKLIGFTTWYRHYENINEEAITKDLQSIKDANMPFKYFQIDDGYENKIGDWLICNKEKFPNGLIPSINKIKEYGYIPGIWLAPFVVSKNSSIYKEHPDWVILDDNDNPIYQGCNWDGAYCLDSDNDEVKQYIHDVFQFYINSGVKLFKLDFLYACSIKPKKNKSRGQIMTEAMEFIRNELKDQIILGCGVPLFPAFFNVDYCRIGCDVSQTWDDVWYMRLFHKERISTKNTIQDTISRHHIDGRGFLNDPDVILLQGTQMTDEQKNLLYEVNAKYGSVAFTSDDVSLYTQEEKDKWFKL